jgi:hypothetical protein
LNVAGRSGYVQFEGCDGSEMVQNQSRPFAWRSNLKLRRCRVRLPEHIEPSFSIRILQERRKCRRVGGRR